MILRWLRPMQWFAIGLLLVTAMSNAATDHGIMMAINCFCLGFVVSSMLLQGVVANTLRNANQARDSFRAAEETCAEIFRAAADRVPLQPGDDHDRPTRH